jgi:hypothetical protein
MGYYLFHIIPRRARESGTQPGIISGYYIILLDAKVLLASGL